MRLLHVSVPRGKRDAVVSVLENEGIEYVLNEEAGRSEFTHVATFPLPTAAVEPGEVSVTASANVVYGIGQ